MNKNAYTNGEFEIFSKNISNSLIRVNKEIKNSSSTIEEFVIIIRKNERMKNALHFYSYVNCFSMDD